MSTTHERMTLDEALQTIVEADSETVRQLDNRLIRETVEQVREIYGEVQAGGRPQSQERR